MRVDRGVLDRRRDVAEQQPGLDRAERDVGALAVRVRGGRLAVEAEEPVARGSLGRPLLQQGEEVPATVLGVDDRLTRFGDVVVGAPAHETDVGHELAVDGDPDGGLQDPGPEALGDRVGVVHPGGVVRVAVAAPHEPGEPLGALGAEEPDVDPRVVHECHTSARWCHGCTVTPRVTRL